jgi:PHP family Zn ribbon phosphoesterase
MLNHVIFALETGLPSDPAMNRLWSELDNFRLISNSDAHSGENLRTGAVPKELLSRSTLVAKTTRKEQPLRLI